MKLSKLIILTAVCTVNLLSKDIDTDIEFKLEDVVKSVVKQNTNLIFEKMNVEISKTHISEAEGFFETNFYINGGKNKEHTKNNTKDAIVRNYTDTYREDLYDFDMGFNGVSSYGANWTLSLKSQRANSTLISETSDKPEYESGLYLEVKQPLLKNFGKDIGEININTAKIKTKELKERYKKNITDTIGNTIASYWRLYSAIEIHKTWGEIIELAKKQEKNIKQRVDAGNMSKVSLFEIQNSIRNSNIEMLTAQDVVNKEKANLLSLLNVSILNNKQNLKPSDKPQIDKIYIPELEDAISKASENWLDLNIIKEKIKQERLAYKYSKNQMEPDLELVGKVDSTTLENSFSESMERISNNEFNSWYVGFNFSIPIQGNIQAKSKVQRSQLNLNKLLLEERTLKNILENSLSTKISNLKINKSKMIKLKETLEFRNKMVDIYTEELKYGKINVEDLTDAYKKRVLAKREWLKGLMDIKLSQTVLEIAIGTLLKKYDINIEE